MAASFGAPFPGPNTTLSAPSGGVITITGAGDGDVWRCVWQINDLIPGHEYKLEQTCSGPGFFQASSIPWGAEGEFAYVNLSTASNPDDNEFTFIAQPGTDTYCSVYINIVSPRTCLEYPTITDLDDTGATVTFASVEGEDLLAFTSTSTTSLSFAFTEGEDLAAFDTVMARLVELGAVEGEDLPEFIATAATGAAIGFQSDAFQSDAYQTEYDEVVLSLWEGKDVAAFNIASTTFTSFAVSEGPDQFYTNVISRTYVQFNTAEGPDVAAFDFDVKTYVTFEVTEGRDQFYMMVLTGAQFTFDLIEGPDVPQFRTFGTWWIEGDADYIYVPYENQTATLTERTPPYILVASENRTAHVPYELRRVDVDQQGAQRREIA